jgi:hypothetical protein
VNRLGHGGAKRAVSGSGDGMLHSILSEAQSVRRRKCARGESRILAGRGVGVVAPEKDRAGRE